MAKTTPSVRGLARELRAFADALERSYPLAPVRDPAALNLTGVPLATLERLAIEQTYAATGTIEQTAAALGIGVRTVHRKLREYRKE